MLDLHQKVYGHCNNSAIEFDSLINNLYRVFNGMASDQSGREAEIDEIMDFLRFSIKPNSTFTGTILFEFKDNDGKLSTNYTVRVTRSKDVYTEKNAKNIDSKSVTCKVSLSVDDFLWIYSGKASGGDIAKLFYSGKLSVSGFALRKVTAFASSFDFAPSIWEAFYERNRVQEGDFMPEDSQQSNATAQNVSRQQEKAQELVQMQWEVFLRNVFGMQSGLCASISPGSLPKLRSTQLSKTLVNVESVPDFGVGASDSATPVRALVPTKASINMASVEPSNDGLGNVLQNLMQLEHAERFKLPTKTSVDFSHCRDRVDITDAGMAQLEKALLALGRDRSARNKKRAKHVPALELLLWEVRNQAANWINLLRKKTVGKKSTGQLPVPDLEQFKNISQRYQSSMMDFNRHTTDGKSYNWATNLVNSSQFNSGNLLKASDQRHRFGKRRLGNSKQRLRQEFDSIQLLAINHARFGVI
uniref:Uncharacterized protein AlNc14C7G974 n=1 Tax=Albugo laibachii Nc14 TaxID=890382 RepID=F0W1N7_9STRA|nr:conserved hypothetical protein [Albugo laibachii Nc14]|eukprot:CCA14966.1 conserved hypothetical protein [Albugo laibachii Nc14]